jgi:hypothetical protein
LDGLLGEKSFRDEWQTHSAKLGRSEIIVILSASTIDRVLTMADDDYAMRLRGLYVEPNPNDPAGAPQTPADVGLVLARAIVENVEQALRLLQEAGPKAR